MRYHQQDDKIILDNSCYELKAPVDSAMVWEATRICQPTCIVLPDIWLDGPATVTAIKEVLNDWRERAFRMSAELMCIPQGKNFKEWLQCTEELAKLVGVGWWGIPRNLVDVHNMSRRDAVEYCQALNSQRKVHLFGFSHDPVEDLLSCRLADSIDSTTPLRAGSLGIDFSITGEALPPRGDWWETAAWNDKILTNLEYANKIF